MARKLRTYSGVVLCCAVLIVGAIAPRVAVAQVEGPDRKYLFLEDKHKKKIEKKERSELKKKKKKAKAQGRTEEGLPFDINATSIGFDSSGNVVNAEGNVIITYSSIVAEAQQGRVDITSNEAELNGDVRVTDVSASMTADTAVIDLNDGSGTLENVDVRFVEGNYRLRAARADREPGDAYRLDEALLTTCNCPEDDECRPWSLRARESKITRNGYGQAWHCTLAVRDVPVFYFPYLFFPVKTERQTGFIPAEIGGGRESGLRLKVPFFWAIDDSTDATITGVYESKVRRGVDNEFRKIFSSNHRAQLGAIYLDDSPRDGDLMGTNVDKLDDPTFDDDRFGGYLDHSWRGNVGPLPVQYILEGKYTSDDLFIREYEKEEIGEPNQRYVTSRAVVRSPLGESFSLDLSGEFNQAIVANDDFVFQRLPQLNISGLNTFRPFGEHPMGLKLVSDTEVSSVNFVRDKSYEGLRSELYEELKLPFYYRNYLDGSIEGSLRGSLYNLSETKVVSDNGDDDDDDDDDDDSELDEFDSESTRLVPGLTSKIGTVLEKVFPVTEGNLIKKVGELGKIGRKEKLVRLRHTIEPNVKHRYVPVVNQDDNPQFDSLDRLAEKNVITYGVTQRLYSRYEPLNPYLYGIEEATPELEDLGNLRLDGPIDSDFDFGLQEETKRRDLPKLRRGSIEELASLKLYQSYDIVEERKDKSSSKEPLSDLGVDLILSPNDHVRLRGKTNFDVEEKEFSSYTIEGQLASKRGDNIRSRLRFIDPRVRQLESSIEVRLAEHVKVGYYTRFDDLSSEFIEQKAGLRLSSACRCWVFDIDVSDKINPDETRFTFKITLVGLGEIGNTFFTDLKRDEENS